MILGNLCEWQRYAPLHPAFEKLFKFVLEHDLSEFPLERIVLDGDSLFINMAEPDLKTAESQKLEIHREYIDVHFPLKGEEICGWTPTANLKTASESPFNEKDDFALYAELAQTYFKAVPGQFYIMYPEDAHAPIVGQGKIKKAIAKVRL